MWNYTSTDTLAIKLFSVEWCNSALPVQLLIFLLLAVFSHTRRAAVLATTATKALSASTAFTPYKRHIYLTTITPFLFPSMTFLFNGYRVTDKLNGLFFKVPQRHMPEPCSGAPLRFCKSSCSQDGDEAKIKFRHEGDAPTPGVYCRCRASLVWDFIAMQSQWPNVLSLFFSLLILGAFLAYVQLSRDLIWCLKTIATFLADCRIHNVQHMGKQCLSKRGSWYSQGLTA